MRAEIDYMERMDARDRGLKKYQPRDPCKRGHLAPRYVSNDACLGCLGRAYIGNPEDLRMVQTELIVELPPLSTDDFQTVRKIVRAAAWKHVAGLNSHFASLMPLDLLEAEAAGN